MSFVSQTPVTSKSYPLRTPKKIVKIPDEYDDELTSEIKKSSAKLPTTKPKTSRPQTSKSLTSKPSTNKTKPQSTSKKSVASAVTTETKQTLSSKSRKSKKVVTEQVVTRSKDSKKKGKSESTSSGVKKVWKDSQKESLDEEIFSTKCVKHPPKSKKPPPPPNSISCLKCNEVFSEVSELTKHERTCYVKYWYSCIEKTCTRTFSQKSLTQQHYQAKHLGQPFVCKYNCSKTFESKKSRDCHEKAVHEVNNKGVSFKYNCKDCDYKTDDKTEYTSHCDHHVNFKRFKCGNCDEGFYTQSHLTNHVRKCKTETAEVPHNPYNIGNEECSKCGQKFKSRSVHKKHFMDKHVKLQNGDLQAHCEVCLYVYASEKGYNTHCQHSNEHTYRLKHHHY